MPANIAWLTGWLGLGLGQSAVRQGLICGRLFRIQLWRRCTCALISPRPGTPTKHTVSCRAQVWHRRRQAAVLPVQLAGRAGHPVQQSGAGHALRCWRGSSQTRAQRRPAAGPHAALQPCLRSAGASTCSTPCSLLYPAVSLLVSLAHTHLCVLFAFSCAVLLCCSQPYSSLPSNLT